MKRKNMLVWLLSLLLVVGSLTVSAFASSGEEPQGTFVLMNIPYADFYAAELGAGDNVDAVSSATLNGKARNVNVNGASYHQSEEAVTSEGIVGATYPVLASEEDLAALVAQGAKVVTDDDSLSYEMSARGQTSTVTLSGSEVLQERPSYSYYVLSEAPAAYKVLTMQDGKPSFSKAQGETTNGTAEGSVTVGARHADIEISLSGVSADPKQVSGVVITAGEHSYALHHVVNIWRGTEIGWNTTELDLGGQTITAIRYLLRSGEIQEYTAEIPIAEAGYVLMNIPYEDFYAADLGENGSVDAVSSATLKYANSGLAGGSYHEVDAAEDAEVKALGVTYPVFVKDLSALDKSLQVTDETHKTIHTVSGREKTITETEVSGADALFCAPSYSWYALDEKPARYKVREEGGSFGAVSGRASAVSDVTGTASYFTHHGNYVEIRFSGITISEAVSGVIVRFDDGSKLALPHVQGFWQKTQIGWAEKDAVAGKTITNVTYITRENVYSCDVELPITDAGYVLMNIPYADFYEAEGVSDVDAVTCATKKAYNPGLVAGTYHNGEDESYQSTDILGVSYPVLVRDLSVLDASAKADSEDALFSAGDYAWYPLRETPSASKALRGEAGAYSFGAISARASALEGVEVSATALTKRGDYEFELSGADALSGSTVFGVILTDSEGTKYALRQLENIWRVTELAICTGHTESIKDGALTPNSSMYAALEGKSLSGITYFIKDAQGAYKTYTISTSAQIPAYPTAAFDDAQTVALSGLREEELSKLSVNADSGETKYFSATVRLGDTVLAEKVPIHADGTITLPKAASEDGDYTVEIIQTNTKKDEDAVFLTLTATFKASGSGTTPRPDYPVTPVTPVQPTQSAAKELPFKDVKKGDWFYDAVADAYFGGLMNGISQAQFAPDGILTRAQVVRILWNLEGQPAAGESTFKDVAPTAYYAKAVAWANANGIVAGISATEFAPDRAITREQFAAIVYRYAKFKGIVKGAPGALTFADASSVSAYAAEALSWASANGIISGMGGNLVVPQGTATRAQAAVIFSKLAALLS